MWTTKAHARAFGSLVWPRCWGWMSVWKRKVRICLGCQKSPLAGTLEEGLDIPAMMSVLLQSPTVHQDTIVWSRTIQTGLRSSSKLSRIFPDRVQHHHRLLFYGDRFL